jgi:hypothetical protein
MIMLDIDKMENCLALLPAPGPQVVGECLEEIRALRSRAEVAEAVVSAIRKLRRIQKQRARDAMTGYPNETYTWSDVAIAQEELEEALRKRPAPGKKTCMHGGSDEEYCDICAENRIYGQPNEPAPREEDGG